MTETEKTRQAAEEVKLYRRAIAALILGENFAGVNTDDLIAEFESAIWEIRNEFPGRV